MMEATVGTHHEFLALSAHVTSLPFGMKQRGRSSRREVEGSFWVLMA